MKLQGIPEPTSTRWRIVAAVIVASAVATILSTYRVFNNFYDEPAHIAAGMEWLDRGTYAREPQAPPLGRVAAAFLPWVAGEHSHNETDLYAEGREVLGRGTQYPKMLTLARLGMLPFFLILTFVVWAWARRLADERTAAIAVGLIAANPNILAHAGIAGTDIGTAALMPAALLAWTLCLESPTVKRSVLAGVTLALCGLTKFSAGAYWVPAALIVAIVYAIRHPNEMFGLAGARRLFRPFLVFAAAGAMTTWAAYRFHVGTVGSLVLPAPEFWIGVRDFFRHGTGGHPAYLLGEVRLAGWWYYDIVALFVKTPIPIMLFAGAGAWASRTEWLSVRRAAVAQNAEHSLVGTALVAGTLAVVGLATLTPIDIGVRLDLPAYAFMSVIAAYSTSRLLASGVRWIRYAVLGLGAWMVAIPIASHPDHIAYFNALAGREPEKVLVDSNLDWGQDLYRLRDAMQELGIDSLRIHYFGTTEFAAIGLVKTRRLRPNERTTGWVAASETFYAGVWADSALSWLHAYRPVARIGSSIRLYNIPAPATPALQPAPPAPSKPR